jgi:4-hydroxy-tetrahydrodipicolinate reductase
MGQMILECARRSKAFELTAAINRGDDLTAALPKGEVVIDFSSHAATNGLVKLCAASGKGMVIGTTGHTPEERETIHIAAKIIPIVLASNFSTGVNVLFWLTAHAAKVLGKDFDREIVEMHHRYKKDSPSGTARRLAEIISQSRNLDLAQVARHGREGADVMRQVEEVGIHSVRGGDVVGDHTVIFASEGERLELTHKASSRETFALGALRAAQWLVEQKPGLYDMQDVLGLT